MQLLELQVGAIEYLRTIQRGANVTQFFEAWWQMWTSPEVYGMPVPDDWDEVNDYGQFLEEYREVRHLPV